MAQTIDENINKVCTRRSVFLEAAALRHARGLLAASDPNIVRIGKTPVSSTRTTDRMREIEREREIESKRESEMAENCNS